MERGPYTDHVTERRKPFVLQTTPPVVENEALGLLRSIDKLATLERPPHLVIGSAHHTLHRALEDSQLIASATIAWYRTHADGTCRDCPTNEPWYCRRV